MTERIDKAQIELAEKEQLVEKQEVEKREAFRKYETLEVAHFELQEKLTVAQI